MTSPPLDSPLSNTPPTDKLEDYSCGWYKDRITIYPGRIYITKNTLVFHPQQIFGQLPIVINLVDVLALHKRNTAYVFPNAIEIVTRDQQKYFFTSFLYRDQAFSKLQELLPHAQRSFEHETDEQLLSDEDKVLSDEDKVIYDDDMDRSRRSPIAIPKALRRTPTSTLSSDEEDSTVDKSIKPKNSAFAAWRRKASEKMNQSLEMETRSLISPVDTQEDIHPETGSTDTNSEVGGDSNSIRRQLDFDTASTSVSAATTTISLVATKDKEDYTPQKRPLSKEESKRISVLESSSKSPAQVTSTGTSSPIPPPTSTNTATIADECTKKADPTCSLELQSLPPVSNLCEHMEYVYGQDFQPFITERFPVTVAHFYKIVIGSSFWSEVNDLSGYTETTMTPWLSNTSSGAQCCSHRQITFRMNISAKIGPKSTRVHQTQRCKLKSPHELALETCSISKDVPYGDNFSVDSLLTVVADGDNTCVLKLASRVKFTKSVWGISGLIEKSALAGNKEFFTLWVSMARSKLEQNSMKGDAASIETPNPHQPQDAATTLIRRASTTLSAPASPGLGTLLTPEIAAKYSPALSSISLSPRLHTFSATTEQSLLGKISSLSGISENSLGYFFIIVVLLSVIFLPFTIYLHSRVGEMESQIANFNSLVGSLENRISFMHVYIEHLKNNTPLEEKQNFNPHKTEFEGLMHIMELAVALEHRMGDWQSRLTSLGDTLTETQKAVAGISGELGIMRTTKPEGSPHLHIGSSYVWFWVTLFATIATVTLSVLYFDAINAVKRMLV